MIESMLNVDDVSKILRCSRASIYRMAAKKELSHFTIRGSRRCRVLRFRRVDIEKFITSNLIPEEPGR